MHCSTRGVSAVGISAAVTVLTERVLTDMLLTTLKVAGTLLVLCALATGAGVLGMQQEQPGQGPARAIERPPEDPHGQRLSELERKFDRILKALDAPDTDVPRRATVSVGVAGAGGFTGAAHTLTDAERLRNLERRVDRLDSKLEQILKELKQSSAPQP
jgi:hypothetical protein